MSMLRICLHVATVLMLGSTAAFAQAVATQLTVPPFPDFTFDERDQTFTWRVNVSGGESAVNGGSVRAVFSRAGGLVWGDVAAPVSGGSAVLTATLPGGTRAQRIEASVEYLPAAGSTLASSNLTVVGAVRVAPVQIAINRIFESYTTGDYAIEPSVTLRLDLGWSLENIPVRDGTVQLTVSQLDGAPVSAWTATVSDGVAHFGAPPLVPRGTRPGVFVLGATYIPVPDNDRYGEAAPQNPWWLTNPPALVITLPLQAFVPLDFRAMTAPAFDETTNTVYIVPGYPISTQHFYAEHPQSCDVVVMDGATYAIRDRLTLPPGGSGDALGWGQGRAASVAVDGRRRRLYVAHVFDVSYSPSREGEQSRVYVYDTLALASGPIEVIDLGVGDPRAMAVDAATGWVYVQRFGSGGDPYVGLLGLEPPVNGSTVVHELTTIATTNTGLTLDPTAKVLYVGDAGVVSVDPTGSGFNEVIWTGEGEPWWTEGRVVNDPRRGLTYLGAPTYFIRDGNPRSSTFMQTVRSAELPIRFLGGELPGLGRPEFMHGSAGNPVNGRVYTRRDASDRSDEAWGFGFSELFVVDVSSGQLLDSYVLQAAMYATAGGHLVSINPVNGDLYLPGLVSGGGPDGMYVYRDVAEAEVPVAAGANVNASFNEASLTFSAVVAEGTTTVQALAPSAAPANPGSFELTSGFAYEISTTATISGPITVCLNAYSIRDEMTFNSLRLLHGENGMWVDRTSSRNYATGDVCGTVTSLSPFAIARWIEPTYRIHPLYDTTRVHRSGSTVPIRIELRDSAGTNVSSAALEVRAIGLLHETSGEEAAAGDSGTSSPGGLLRFDPGLGNGGGYIYNLSTRGLASGSWTLRMNVGDGARVYTVRVVIGS